MDLIGQGEGFALRAYVTSVGSRGGTVLFPIPLALCIARTLTN